MPILSPYSCSDLLGMKRINALLCFVLVTSGTRASVASINSGADLKEAIATTKLVSRGCIRLLNSTGTVGCSSHQSGALVRYDGNHLALKGSSVVVTDEAYLSQLLAAILSADGDQSNKVGGILVMRNATEGSNPDMPFPQAEFALYSERHYAWNSHGDGHMWIHLPFSIQYVSPDMEARIAKNADSNSVKGLQGDSEDLYEADMDSSMSGKVDSQTCLPQGQCDPLGGHSVLAWMPQPGSVDPDLPTTLVLAQSDSIGLVHDDIIGADSPLSGFVAMLAGVEALASHSQQSSMTRRLAFAALAGEPWGYMGSKRLLWEMEQNTSSVHGLSLDHVDQIIEIGSVGRMKKGSSSKAELFVHSQKKGSAFGDTAALLKELANAGASLKNLTVSEASSKNPGIPPSSLSSFLRVKPGISGVVLTEFDQRYINPHYATSYDGLEGINTQGIASTALLLAQVLAAQSGQASLPAESAGAIQSRVEELLQCVARSGSLLRCRLADRLITTLGTQSNYVGVLHTLTKDPQEPNVNVKNDMARFAWNFLANATSAGKASTKKGDSNGCHPSNKPCQENAICVGYRISEKESASNGQCQLASVRFVASYSTAIQCKDCDGNSWGRWSMTNVSQSWESRHKWPRDPVTTESRWNNGIPSYSIYQIRSKQYGVFCPSLLRKCLLRLALGRQEFAVAEDHVPRNLVVTRLRCFPLQKESARSQARGVIVGALVTLVALLLAQILRRSEPRRYQKLSEFVKTWL